MRHTSSWKLLLKKTVIRSSFSRLPILFTLHYYASTHFHFLCFLLLCIRMENGVDLEASPERKLQKVYVNSLVSLPPHLLLLSTRVSGNMTNTRYVPTPMPKLSSSTFFWMVSPLEHFSLRGMDSASGPGILSIVSCVGYARSWISPLGLFSKHTLTTPKVGEVGYVLISF